MKYILVIGDGMADNALRALDGKTPLQCAKKPRIDAMAKAGLLGSVCNVPEGYPPGSDTAIMSIFGCAPEKYYSGRAPLEAAAQGKPLTQETVDAFANAILSDINPRDSWRASKAFRQHIALEIAKRCLVKSIELAGGELA